MEDALLQSRIHWRAGYTGGEDAFEGWINWMERIHCRRGYTVGMDALKGGRTECIMHCNR